jgi:hypothetical protein
MFGIIIRGVDRMLSPEEVGSLRSVKRDFLLLKSHLRYVFVYSGGNILNHSKMMFLSRKRP